jgi:hypothetical protein
MGALLALIPGKDIVYGIIIVAILAGFGAYTVHERHLGAAHEVAALRASSDKIQADTDRQTADLKARATMAEQAYDKEHTSIANLHVDSIRVCNPTYSRSLLPSSAGKVAGNALERTGAAGLQQVPEGDLEVAGPDIGPMLDALAARADEVSATLREFQSR